MIRRDAVSALLVTAAGGLALATGLSSPGSRGMAPRTDQQAQARTTTDIQQVGTAMFSWLTDQVGAAAAGQSQVPVDLTNYPEITRADLATLRPDCEPTPVRR